VNILASLSYYIYIDSDYVEQLQVAQQPSHVNIPSVERLKETIDAFKESLVATEEAAFPVDLWRTLG